MSYRSRKGRRYEKPYPFVKYMQFSEFDINYQKLWLDKCNNMSKTGNDDINFLIHTIAREGTSLGKIIAKKGKNPSKPLPLLILKSLLEKYDIKERPDTSKTCTLWRIGCLYCREISFLFGNKIIKPYLHSLKLESEQTFRNYPLFMMHLFFAPLIPSPQSCINSHIDEDVNQNNIVFNSNGKDVKDVDHIVPGHPKYNTSPQDLPPLEISRDTDLKNLLSDSETESQRYKKYLTDSLKAVQNIYKDKNMDFIPVLSITDFEYIYYGYAEHQRIFYKTLISTSKNGNHIKKLKSREDILRYIDQQIAFPILTEQEKFLFLESLGLLTRCESPSIGEKSENNRLIFQLTYSFKTALLRAKTSWDDDDAPSPLNLLDDLGLVLFPMD